MCLCLASLLGTRWLAILHCGSLASAIRKRLQANPASLREVYLRKDGLFS